MKEHGRNMRRISLRAAHAGASREIASPSGRSWLRALARGAAALAVASLGACALSKRHRSLINLPDGQTGYALNCSGADASSSWASCYVLAGRKCGATGYDIVSKDTRKAARPAAASPT